MNIETIEKHAGDYAADRAHLAAIVGRMNAEIEAIKAKYLPPIRVAVRHVAERHDTLRAAIEDGQDLFVKPKTRVLMGVKVGYRKQKGSVTFADEAAVIERIKRLLPEEQAALLIRVRESLDKNACYDLAVPDLKRLGIGVERDEDIPVIKPADSEVDKLVDALLKDAEQIEAAA